MDLFSEEITERLDSSNDSTYDVHEGKLDRLFVAASQTYESSSVIDHTSLEPIHADTGTGTSHTLSDSCSSPTPPPTLTSRFALPKSDADIKNARKKGIPQTTQRDTSYCTAIWKSWREYRNATSTVKIPPLCGKSGKPQLVFFKDPEFADFCSSLDAEMKRLHAQDIGSKKKTG